MNEDEDDYGPPVWIEGHEFYADGALVYPIPIPHAPNEVLHILININRSVLEDENRPDWVDISACTATIQAALDELALRAAGFLAVVVTP